MSAAPETVLTVHELARAWALVASRTTYLPMSGEEVQQLLTRLIERLVVAMAAPRVDEQAVIEVAAELVRNHLTGPRSAGCGIKILGDGLPRLAALQDTGGLDTTILTVLGALADGYSEALRQQTFNEQEVVNQALLIAKQRAEHETRVSEARFREIFSVSAVGIAISDFDGVLVDANKAFAALVGGSPTELAGSPLLSLLQAADDTVLREAYRQLTSRELPSFRLRRRLVDADGDEVCVYLAGTLLHDPYSVPTHHVTVVENFTELNLLQKQLSEQALHDRLTRLPNEHYFMSRLQDVLEGADPAALITVCRVNLDCFSVINDGIGRVVGEQLLCSVAGRLLELVVGERAMVARMGTDDFAILIEDGPRTPELRLLAASINEVLSEPFYVGDQGLAVSAGVGVVRRRAGGISAGELIRAADATLHRVKRTGRGQWGLYDPEADTLERGRYQTAAAMPGAYENGELSLVHQPLYSLRTGRVVAVAALLRWNRADGTVVDHPDCFALAEQTGLMLTIGRWMLRQACIELTSWRSALDDPTLALRIDLTARLSRDPDLISVVHDALAGTGVRADQLQIGVPLDSLSRDRGETVDNVQVLADLRAGVVLLGAAAGPGYLAYLEDLPVAAVEIAPQTVRRLATAADDSVVAQAVRQSVPLVHSLGVSVTVPDVDTAEQAQWWRAAGADAARGAHFGQPAR